MVIYCQHIVLPCDPMNNGCARQCTVHGVLIKNLCSTALSRATWLQFDICVCGRSQCTPVFNSRLGVNLFLPCKLQVVGARAGPGHSLAENSMEAATKKDVASAKKTPRKPAWDSTPAGKILTPAQKAARKRAGADVIRQPGTPGQSPAKGANTLSRPNSAASRPASAVSKVADQENRAQNLTGRCAQAHSHGKCFPTRSHAHHH